MTTETPNTGTDNTPDVIVVQNDAAGAGRHEQSSVDDYKAFEAKMLGEAAEATAGGANTSGETPEQQKSAADAKAAEEAGETGDDEAKAAEEAEAAKAAGTPAVAAKPAGDKPAGKPGRKSAAERIGELVKDRGEAQREVERLRAENEALRTGKAPKIAAAETPADEDAEPDPQKFEYGELDPGYRKAVREFDKAQILKSVSADRQKQAAEHSALELQKAHDAQVEALDQEVGDYVEVVVKGAQENLWACSADMSQQIKESPEGAKIAYHLAKNPAESIKVFNMDRIAQAKWFGRKEAELSAPPAPAGKSGKTAAVSKADPPANVVRGQKGHFAPNAATEDFSAFEKAHAHLLEPGSMF